MSNIKDMFVLMISSDQKIMVIYKR